MMETRASGRTQNDRGFADRAAEAPFTSNTTTLSDTPGHIGWVTHQIEDLLVANLPLPPYERWSASLNRDLEKLKKKVDGFRDAPGREIVGQAQLDWVKNVSNASSSGGTTWQLFGQAAPVQDHLPADYWRAIQNEIARGNLERAQLWAEVMNNMTSLARNNQTASSYTSFSPEFSRREILGHQIALDWSTSFGVLVKAVAGHYGLLRAFDDWQSHTIERSQLLRIIAETTSSTNPVVYGGDSHDALVGELRTEFQNDSVAYIPEFDVMSVTSPNEAIAAGWAPPAMLDAGTLSANPHLLWADQHSHGYMLVSLTHASHSVQFVGTTTASPHDDEYVESTCLAAFEVANGVSERLKRVPCNAETSRSSEDLLV